MQNYFPKTIDFSLALWYNNNVLKRGHPHLKPSDQAKIFQKSLKKPLTNGSKCGIIIMSKGQGKSTPYPKTTNLFYNRKELMSMSIKKTQKQYFEEILGMLDSEEHKDFIKSRIEALDKKSTSRKPTAEQKRNEENCEIILANLEPSTLYTVTDIHRMVSALADESFSYVNALVKKLKDNGSIERVVEKGKAYFRLA